MNLALIRCAGHDGEPASDHLDVIVAPVSHGDQQQPSTWTGGHGTLPYEQNTQQSPSFGRSTAPHAGQSQKNWQASVGIAASVS